MVSCTHIMMLLPYYTVSPSPYGSFAAAHLLPPLLQLVSEITVTRALHDCLRARELNVGTEALSHRKVRTAHQQESQLGRAELIVELRVATPGDVYLEGIRRLLDHLVIESVSPGEPIERRSHLVAQVTGSLRLAPLFTELSIHAPERVSNDRVRALLAEFRSQGFDERNQHLRLDPDLLDHRDVHASPRSVATLRCTGASLRHQVIEPPKHRPTNCAVGSTA